MIFLLFIGAGWYFSKLFSNKFMIGMVYLIFILVFSKSLLRQASQSSLDESSQKESPLLSPDTTCYENLDHYSKSYLKLNDMRKYTELGFFNCSLTTRHPLYIFSFFYRNSFLCDVILVANGNEFPAHKNVLASCSPYFQAMFTCFEESKQHRIILKDIDPKALELLLEYIYTSKIQITEDNVQVK